MLISDYLVVTCLLVCTSNQLRSPYLLFNIPNWLDCLPSASPRAVKLPTKQEAKLNRVKNFKKERENGQGGGPTMCPIYCCPPNAQMCGVTFHFEVFVTKA